MGNPAIFPLIYNSDCQDILILHINPIFRDQVPETAVDILNRMNEISFNSSLMREMRAISFVSKILDDGWIKDKYKKNIKRMYMHAVRADITMEGFSVASKLNTDWSFLSALYEEGRKEGAEWLKQNFDHLGKKTTIDLDEYL
jgi:NTE family protein